MKKRILIIVCLLFVNILMSCGIKEKTVNSDCEQDQDKNTSSEVEKIDHSECKLDSLEQLDDGMGVAIFESVKHDYILDLPEKTKGAPLVVMLHGYGESAEAFRQNTSFEEEATTRGYAVLYVTGAPNPADKTSASGWNSGIGISGNNDVDFICALVNELCKIYLFDRNRVYAVGFSNGGFMTHRLAVEANDIFAAIVSVAGMMPENIWEHRPTSCDIGVLQITGEKDDVVPKNSDGSAKFSKAPAIEEVMDYYVKVNGLTMEEKNSIGKKSILEKYISSDSKKQVWNVFIPDGRHSWPDEEIVGFHTNQIIIDFLEIQ